MLEEDDDLLPGPVGDDVDLSTDDDDASDAEDGAANDDGSNGDDLGLLASGRPREEPDERPRR